MSDLLYIYPKEKQHDILLLTKSETIALKYKLRHILVKITAKNDTYMIMSISTTYSLATVKFQHTCKQCWRPLYLKIPRFRSTSTMN